MRRPFLLLFIAIASWLAPAFAETNKPAALILEAEEFSPGGAWAKGSHGENYYAGTFANTFLSRKAFLGAPAQSRRSTATKIVTVPQAGRYLVLARYEAVFRHETQFRVVVRQNGVTLLNWRYGARSSTKIWPFGKRLTNEVAWDWGATENIVWEGHDRFAELKAGEAAIDLIVDRQEEPAARRNVDLIMLTPDAADVQKRIEKESYLPLDGLLTQQGDLFARVHNTGAAPVIVTFQPCTEHSPYWVHQRTWKPVKVTCAPGDMSTWIEVGSQLDSLNDGQWQISIAGERSPVDLEFGVPSRGGNISSIRRFAGLTGSVSLAYDANTRVSRRIRGTDEVLYELVEWLREHPVKGQPPKRTLIYGSTFHQRPDDARYNAALREFIDMIGATALSTGDRKLPMLDGLRRDYVDVRDQSVSQLERTCRKLMDEGRAEQIVTVSLGDEISLPRPGAQVDDEFRAWLRSRGVSARDLDADDLSRVRYKPDSTNNAVVFYYSNLYRHRAGIAKQKELTDVLRKSLPHAGIGANYSPHHGEFYLGETHKWISLFREGGMTLPWSEDYIFQMPMGSQQMNFLPVDMFRAAIAHDESMKIHYYVMPHWPGNNPASWRRQFYGDLAHGVKVFNLFEFRSVQAAYTENHCSSPEMYQAVRKAFHELGTFEEMVQDGRVRRGVAALWFSETADIWKDNQTPFAAGKRTLYIGIRHQQLPVDVVVEGDDLSHYRVLYLTDRHVSSAASHAIARWVKNGGTLLATAGAGMFDEFNRPNEALRTLVGVEEKEMAISPQPIRLEKQDLPYAPPIASVRWGAKVFPAFGARSAIQVAAGTKSLGHFTDGDVALTERHVGRGRAIYCAFLPGLSYFHPALPKRPMDRSSREESMSHFIPTRFDATAGKIIELAALGVARPVTASNPLVETTVIDSPHGVLITLNNWSGRRIRNLEVTLHRPRPFTRAARANGDLAKWRRRGPAVIFTCDLDVADILALRP